MELMGIGEITNDAKRERFKFWTKKKFSENLSAASNFKRRDTAVCSLSLSSKVSFLGRQQLSQ